MALRLCDVCVLLAQATGNMKNSVSLEDFHVSHQILLISRAAISLLPLPQLAGPGGPLQSPVCHPHTQQTPFHIHSAIVLAAHIQLNKLKTIRITFLARIVHVK